MQENNTSNKRKFEIELYEEITDDEGNIKGRKKVISEQPIIIEASDKADLDRQAMIFKQCGQVMKIIRVIEDQNTTSDVKQSLACQPSITEDKTNLSNIQNQLIQSQTITSLPTIIKKPRYYSVGGIEVKEDNGKIYQKQWVRLTENEAKNIRLVNETTNKIVNTNGKCYEMKKWILVETTSEDDSSNLMDLCEND